MSYVLTRETAKAVLPFMLCHSARLLAESHVPGAQTLINALRLGVAGGMDIDLFNEKNDDGRFPAFLDTFTRAIARFEDVAYGSNRPGEPGENPHPWMLHAAAHALFHENALLEVAEEFNAVERRPIRNRVPA